MQEIFNIVGSIVMMMLGASTISYSFLFGECRPLIFGLLLLFTGSICLSLSFYLHTL
jgi:hypothetical protein